jgi:hypothetical protein
MESKITSFSPEKDELDLMICKDVEAMQWCNNSMSLHYADVKRI